MLFASPSPEIQVRKTSSKQKNRPQLKSRALQYDFALHRLKRAVSTLLYSKRFQVYVSDLVPFLNQEFFQQLLSVHLLKDH